MDHLRAYYHYGELKITVAAVFSMALMYQNDVRLSDEDLKQRMLGVGKSQDTGLITDFRSLEMIMGGCCPDSLLLEFIASEGAPD